MFPGVLTAEEFDGVGDKWLGVTTTVDLHTLLKAFLIISLTPAHFIDQFFYGQIVKSPGLVLLSTSAKLLGFSNSQMLD